MSQSLDLYRLQRIDTQYEKISSRFREIDQILQKDEALSQAQKLMAEAENSLQSARNILRLAEGAVQSQSIKIEQNEASLYGGKVKNPKELQDLQNENLALKRYKSVLEDKQLDAMIALEAAEAEHKTASANLKQVQDTSEQKNAKLVAERDSLQRDIERLDSERQVTAAPIPADILSIYNKLRQQKRGLAVAAVIDETCAACGSTLTPAYWQAARSPHQISYCPTCGRILYAG